MNLFLRAILLANLFCLPFCGSYDCDDLKQVNGELMNLVREQGTTIQRMRERLDELEGKKASETATSSESLRLITRNEWQAQAPKHELTNLSLPVDKVIILHSATEGCDTQVGCNVSTYNLSHNRLSRPRAHRESC